MSRAAELAGLRSRDPEVVDRSARALWLVVVSAIVDQVAGQVVGVGHKEIREVRPIMHCWGDRLVFIPMDGYRNGQIYWWME